MHLPPPQDNQYLFLDMNAFFASCEQHRQPALRGKPVAVTPTLAPSGCVIAASYEAKRRGVTTGCRVQEAKDRIADIQVVRADHKYYTEVHYQLHQLLEREIAPSPLRLSIDEFAIPLDTREQWTPNAHAQALLIKQAIARIFSPYLRCSIGIGPNLFLAKLGTEIHKPNGLVIIQRHTLEAAYQTLSLRDIPGINWGMSHRLHSLGIRTPLAFYRAPRELLEGAFGVLGRAWWYHLHGYRVPYADRPTKSMSHSHVLAPVLRTKTRARAVLYKLCLKVVERLRTKQLATRNIFVKVKSPQGRWTHTVTLAPTQNPFTIFQAVATFYDALPSTVQPNHLYVVAFHLQPNSNRELPLFTTTNAQASDLFRSVDRINHRYGRWSVKPASLLSVGDTAPNRIAFQVPDYEMD